MFLLRCAFWLSIVYASILWPRGLHGPLDPAAPARAAALIVDRTIAGAGDICARHGQECLAGAARLTALLASQERDGPGRGARLDDSAVLAGAAPLPVRDPRRHMR